MSIDYIVAKEDYDDYMKIIDNQKKEIKKLNSIINKIDEILIEHIDECREELNTIMKMDDLNYINECAIEFNVIRKNIEMIMEKIKELKGDENNG